MAKVNKEKFLDKLENEAIELLDQFKEHPIKSVFVAIIILWGIKQIKNLLTS